MAACLCQERLQLSARTFAHGQFGPQDLILTQESISSILGVRRESVTAIARKLQEAGTICYRRGHIMVIDQAGIQKETCECYKKSKRNSTWYLMM